MLARVFIIISVIMCALPALVLAEVVSGIAAIVNEDIITIRDLDREYAPAARDIEKRQGPLSAESAKELRSDVLNSMVDRKLVRDKISELNIVISEEEIRQSIEETKKQNGLSQEALVSALITQGMTFDQYKAQIKEQLERLRLISQEVKSRITVSEEEVKAYYDNNPAEFTEEGDLRAKAIFFGLSGNADATEVRQVMGKIVTVLANVRKKEDFTELAKKYSDDPNAQQDGGDLGQFKKGEMLAEIEEKLVTMNPGEVSDLVSTPAGFHVIRLEDKKPPTAKHFEAVKTQIEETLYAKKSEERFKQWAAELRKDAAVLITIKLVSAPTQNPPP